MPAQSISSAVARAACLSEAGYVHNMFIRARATETKQAYLSGDRTESENISLDLR